MFFYKGVTQEVNWINVWDLITLSDVLTTFKDIFYLRIDVLGIRLVLSFLIPPKIVKGYIHVMVYGEEVIFWGDRVQGQDVFVIF